MRFDQQRLWLRNLARDDKVASSNGKELRYPFLAKELADLVAKVDKKFLLGFQKKNLVSLENATELDKIIIQILHLTEEFKNKKKETVFYNKLILRNIAFRKKLIGISILKKKAIQFGTGLSKKINKSIK